MDRVGFEPTTSAMPSGLTAIIVKKKQTPLTDDLDSAAGTYTCIISRYHQGSIQSSGYEELHSLSLSSSSSSIKFLAIAVVVSDSPSCTLAR